MARPFIGDGPFVVAYPDDIHLGEKPLTRQLIETYEKTGCSVPAAIHDPPDIVRYGAIAIAEDGLHASDIVEKPRRAQSRAGKPRSGVFYIRLRFFPCSPQAGKSTS